MRSTKQIRIEVNKSGFNHLQVLGGTAIREDQTSDPSSISIAGDGLKGERGALISKL